ncbi:SgcJ/EcaC family oxidoreductase [Streptomyces sp.]|uniref:SgcJ/EcaC family oxidoreductase n=1 Tax=Streptomyces sp. TaxID=1931 RepID=UPI0026009E8C|nr:SgcJ/EcaC family oxidoreductase [Streptomyces sp.]
MRFAVVAATVTVGVSQTGGSRTPHEPGKKQITGLFDRWNAALRTGDLEKVADLYAKDAVLLPTVSNEIRTDHAGIVDYFEHFLHNKPVGEKKRTIVKGGRWDLRAVQADAGGLAADGEPGAGAVGAASGAVPP